MCPCVRVFTLSFILSCLSELLFSSGPILSPISCRPCVRLCAPENERGMSLAYFHWYSSSKHNSTTVVVASVGEMAGKWSFCLFWRLFVQINTRLVELCTQPVEKTEFWQGRLMGWAPPRIATQPFLGGGWEKGFNQGQIKHWLCRIWGRVGISVGAGRMEKMWRAEVRRMAEWAVDTLRDGLCGKTKIATFILMPH